MSKDQQKSDLSPQEVTDRIWELAEKIDICMFTTWDGKQPRARPLSARVFREEHVIHFLVDEEGAKNAQIDQNPIVTLAWADNSAYKYVTITGRASVKNDRDLIADLWEKTDKAWWDDETDPSIRVITVSPTEGELWDSPSKLVAMTKMIAAALTGAKPDMGDNAKTRL
ncbi:pyridoxamine 5'-phosphate oxidase family protein [Aestuariivirga litoralis]|uniref:pyridoxamine 5'-phosphate oxidase family protein n=1 Tax=Aestuariivirga litoralis TaxID=2650924 RepID=UPI0018C65BA2|nr:pyridoxamine 5'-phosphate oxidase family protein [Aestuariivirga litoralis]MBG1231593.1 general stress protein [Aestuariivirga litoralis]